jgi:cytoplasmic iron level regulating protein YaaA (DUF328/UPF0246 family)
MLILLSPAKNLDWAAPPADLARTQPVLRTQTASLAKVAKGLSVGDLQQLMGISQKLAELNKDRFETFTTKAEPDAGKQAVLAFNGEVYLGLSAKTLTHQDLDWAQDRLRILSGLYGILRPLDAISPYRLEMGTKLKTSKGTDLYDFWGDAIAKSLKADLKAHANPVVLNLASDEYFSAVDTKALGAPVITPRFLDVKDGKARSVFLFVKQARGLMARFAILNRIEDPAQMKAFDLGGYRFHPDQSSDLQWTFSRKQPPPVAQTRAKKQGAP